MMAWLDDFKRPINVISIGIGVLGIFLAIYLAIKGEKSGQISMSVEQIQVFDKTRVGQLPLRVIDAAGNPIKENVYAANVAIWNSGNAEIKAQDVRRSFRLFLENQTSPLEMTITYYTNENVDKFTLTPSGGLSWMHFDPGEGVRIRIMYATEQK